MSLKFSVPLLIVSICTASALSFMYFSESDKTSSLDSEATSLETSVQNKKTELTKIKKEAEKEKEFYQKNNVKLLAVSSDIDLYDFKFKLADMLSSELHTEVKVDMDTKMGNGVFGIPMTITFEYKNPLLYEKFFSFINMFLYQTKNISYSTVDRKFKFELILYAQKV
jgi:hypothetical protein